MKSIFYLLFCFCAAASSLSSLETEDKETIQRIISQFTDGWNHSSGEELAEHYSEEAGFVNIFGMLFSGKEEIETRHVKILNTILKGSTFEVTNQQLREVLPGLVIANVWWKISHIQPSETFNSTLEGIMTHVFVKQSQSWSITFTQNTSKTQP